MPTYCIPELVFTTWVGTPLEPGNVNRHFIELRQGRAAVDPHP